MERICASAREEQFASLRFVVVGAEKLREPLRKEFEETFGIDLLEGYGMTEMSPVVAVNTPDFREGKEIQIGTKHGTVGLPIPGVAVRIVDPETMEPLPPGQEGMLLVKGPNRMIGYLNQPERTAQVFHDGWYITGDMAKVDEDGFLSITDRLSRFSKVGGEMVPHLLIEDMISKACQDASGNAAPCAVTGLPDERKGETARRALYGSDDHARGALAPPLRRPIFPSCGCRSSRTSITWMSCPCWAPASSTCGVCGRGRWNCRVRLPSRAQ